MRNHLQKILLILVWGLSLVFIFKTSAFAVTYYVSPTGSDTNPGTSAQPWASFSGAFGKMKAGDTLIVKDGTYSSGISNPPSGSAGGYTIVKAENEGTVIINGDLGISHTNAYLQFEGLRFHSQGKTILGNHIRFFRTEFKNGCSSGNCVNLGIGTNDYSDTADILLEEVWLHGSGGRYNVLIYNADRVIVRRAVIRHDGGWTDQKGDPEAGINFYNAANSAAQNVIVLDSNLNYHTWQTGLYSVHNPNSGSHPTQNIVFKGCLSLVGAGTGLTNEGDQITGSKIEDCVLWDTNNGGISFGGSGSVAATVNRMTIGRSQLSSSGDFMGGIGAWNSGTKTVTNAIITGLTSGADFQGVSASYFDTYNNGQSSSGTGRVTYNPLANGLMYLPRIEAGSPLKTAGSGGGQMGAQIVNRIGTSGAVYGEAGWDTDTGTTLWPWPNEARIKKEMCTEAGVTRGFCGAQTLTKYIWEYLGNPIPAEIYGGTPPVQDTPAAPKNLRLR